MIEWTIPQSITAAGVALVLLGMWGHAHPDNTDWSESYGDWKRVHAQSYDWSVYGAGGGGRELHRVIRREDRTREGMRIVWRHYWAKNIWPRSYRYLCVYYPRAEPIYWKDAPDYKTPVIEGTRAYLRLTGAHNAATFPLEHVYLSDAQITSWRGVDRVLAFLARQDGQVSMEVVLQNAGGAVVHTHTVDLGPMDGARLVSSLKERPR